MTIFMSIIIKREKIEINFFLNLPIRIGNCYDGCGVLEIQRRLHFEFTESAVSVTDLDHHRKSRLARRALRSLLPLRIAQGLAAKWRKPLATIPILLTWLA